MTTPQRSVSFTPETNKQGLRRASKSDRDDATLLNDHDDEDASGEGQRGSTSDRRCIAIVLILCLVSIAGAFKVIRMHQPQQQRPPRTTTDAAGGGLSTRASTRVAAAAARQPRATGKDLDPYAEPRRIPALQTVIQQCNVSARAHAECGERDIYLFGIFTGSSIRVVLRVLHGAGVPFHTLWGFDSFVGLPDDETQTQQQGYKVKDGEWSKGSFSTATLFGKGTSASAAASGLKRRLLADGVPSAERVQFVQGFYNESLTPALPRRRGMRPALYVDLDVDLYSSTYGALDWMLTHQLMPGGTVLYYDDWGSGGKVGQRRAHRDAFHKHGGARASTPGGRVNATEVPRTRGGGMGMRVYRVTD